MKKNMKIGLMAGLLITPAVVAQAGEAEASGAVAAIGVDALLNQITNLNESTSATAIQEAKQLYNAQINADPAAINADLQTVITKKFAYLEAFIASNPTGKAESVIASIKAANLDIEAAKTAVTNFESDFNTLIADLRAVQTGAGEEALKMLSALKYFDATAGTQKYVTDYIKSINMTSYNTAMESFDEITAVKALINPLLPTNKETVDVAGYKTAVNDAVTKMKTAKTIVKNQLVSVSDTEKKTISTIVDEANKELSAATTLETEIKNFSTNMPSTVTTYLSKVTDLEKKSAALSEFQKRFITNIGDVEKLTKAKAVVNQIKDLDTKPFNTADYRTKVTDARTAYNALGSEALQPLVINTAKLTEVENIITDVKTVEDKVASVTNGNLATAIPEAVKAYTGLTSTKQGYLLEDKLATLKSWDTAVKSSATVIKDIDAISTNNFATWGSATTTQKVSTTKSFVSKVNSAFAKYNAIVSPTTEGSIDPKSLVTNSARLLALKEISDIANSIVTLTALSARDEATLTTAKTVLNGFKSDAAGLSNEDKLNLPNLQTFLGTNLQEIEDEQLRIKEVESLIEGLKTTVDLVNLSKAREEYNKLSREGQGLVANYATLTNLERDYKVALTVVNQIEALDPTAKDFARKVVSAQIAYDKLATASLKAAVSNYSTLQQLQPIAQLMQEIDALRTNAKEFRANLEKAQSTFNTLTAGTTAPGEGAEQTVLDKLTSAKQRLVSEYGPKLVAFQEIIKKADEMVNKITALGSKSGKEFMDELALVSAEYKKLESAVKGNVSNASDLTALEKDFNSSLKVYNLIEQLPANSDKSFSKKVVAAEKTYQKLTEKQKANVYNYTKLSQVLKAADLIERIEKLKIGSKTFEMDVAAIRGEFNALSTADQALVHNIAKLTAAEDNMTSAEKVIALINEAVPTATNYIEKLTEARKAFDALDRSQQKLVTNAKDLTTRERSVKPVLKLDEDILKLDPSNAKTYVSKYNSALKAYEKLSLVERGLLLNAEAFTGELKTIYEVINAINSIKNSSKTFIADTKAARTLYEALTAEQKAKISNLSVLQDHELNVEGGAKVDEMIRALSSVDPQQFIAKVKEASDAYKALSSTNKKAVSLINELKAQEKYIKPVEKAITEIEGLSNPRNDLTRQFTKVNSTLQKLDEKQRSYITNMDKYSNLSNVIHVYQLIDKLKPSDRYYQGNLEAAKLAYDRLTQDEKLKVTNYYKLQEAQMNVAEAQVMINLIASLSRKSSTYVADVENALKQYKELPSALKKQISNYDVLKQAEKDIKAAQKVMKQIEELDATARSYESRVKSAVKAYEKLTEEQKQLVANYNLLQNAVSELGLEI